MRFLLLSNNVPLYICIYCIMLVNLEIKYFLTKVNSSHFPSEMIAKLGQSAQRS